MRNDNLVDVLKPMRNSANDKEIEALFMEANIEENPTLRNQFSKLFGF